MGSTDFTEGSESQEGAPLCRGCVPLKNVPICHHHPVPAALLCHHSIFFSLFSPTTTFPPLLCFFLLSLSQALTILFSIYFAYNSCQKLQLPHISSKSPPLAHPAHEGKHRGLLGRNSGEHRFLPISSTQKKRWAETKTSLSESPHHLSSFPFPSFPSHCSSVRTWPAYSCSPASNSVERLLTMGLN